MTDNIESMFDLTKKKRKNKKTKKINILSKSEITENPAKYDYKNELLLRIITKLQINNPELIENKKVIIQPPQVIRSGTKKTLWINFQHICNTINRKFDHVLLYMMSELGTTGAIDNNQRLLIKGRFPPSQIESILRTYIIDFVRCSSCHKLETILTKDNISRLTFIYCHKCGSSKTVDTIKSGFHATTRAERMAARKEM